MELKEIEPQKALVIRATTRMTEIGQALGVIFPEVWGYMQQNDITPAGPPLVRYLTMEDGVTELEGGLPISEEAQGTDRIVEIELPGGKVANAWHIGPYEKLGETYDAMREWIVAQPLAPAAAPWEIYWTNPSDSPDPSTWKTEIVWPVR